MRISLPWQYAFLTDSAKIKECCLGENKSGRRKQSRVKQLFPAACPHPTPPLTAFSATRALLLVTVPWGEVPHVEPDENHSQNDPVCTTLKLCSFPLGLFIARTQMPKHAKDYSKQSRNSICFPSDHHFVSLMTSTVSPVGEGSFLLHLLTPGRYVSSAPKINWAWI